MEPATPTNENIDIDDGILALMSRLPVPVQEFLSSDERNEVVLNLSKKYGLHTDQAGVFESAFLLMMLGVDSPEAFSNTLRSQGLPNETIQGLMSDLNTEVFLPLRNAERSETIDNSNQSPAKPQVTSAPQTVEIVSSTSALETTVPLPAPEKPTMRTFASDVEQIKHEATPTPQTFTPSQTPAAPAPVQAPELKVHAPYAPQQTSVPQSPRTNVYTPAPMPRAPQAEPVASVSEPAPAHPLPPRTTAPTHQEVTHSLKQYGIDPYREIPE